jgi:hypothetical protein
MASGITQKREPIYLNDSMVTYNHMDEEQGKDSHYLHQTQSKTRILWTVVAEEALIALMTMALIWISLG